MKHLLFFLLIGGLASLCSCSKSDKNPEQELLQGQWNITSFIDIDGDEQVDNTDPEFSTLITMGFLADGKVTFELKYTAKASGESSTELVTGTYTWENDHTLRISFTSPDNTVLTGIPLVTDQDFSGEFSAVATGGNGVVKLVGKRI